MANIAIDARPLCSGMDGIARYSYELIRQLTLQPQHTWYLYSHKPLTVELHTTNIRIAKGRFNNSALSAQLLFPNWAKADKIDVFWTPRHHLPLRIRCPTIVTIHDLCWIKAASTMPTSRYILERLLMPPSLSKADRIAVVSHSTRDDLLRKYPALQEKTDVVSPGAPSFNPTSFTHNQTPYIVCVGTIEPRKGYQLLLKTFARIKDDIPHNLIIIGKKGWGKVNLRVLCEELDITNRVEWHEKVNDDQLAHFYKNASLYVSASRYEGFNLPLLEAMHHNLPIVATDIPVHREVAGECATYSQPSPTKLAEAIRRVLGDKGDGSMREERSTAKLSTYSWEKSVLQMRLMLESLILETRGQ